MMGVEHYKHVSTEPIPTGDVLVRMHFDADRQQPSTGGTVSLYANHTKIGEGRIERTVAVRFSGTPEWTSAATTACRSTGPTRPSRPPLHRHGEEGRLRPQTRQPRRREGIAQGRSARRRRPRNQRLREADPASGETVAAAWDTSASDLGLPSPRRSGCEPQRRGRDRAGSSRGGPLDRRRPDLVSPGQLTSSSVPSWSSARWRARATAAMPVLSTFVAALNRRPPATGDDRAPGRRAGRSWIGVDHAGEGDADGTIRKPSALDGEAASPSGDIAAGPRS